MKMVMDERYEMYEMLEYLTEWKQFSFINKEFKKLILYKYSNFKLPYDEVFSILAYEIVEYFPICKYEEYIRLIFTYVIPSTSDINMHIKLAYILSRYSDDTEYKEKVFDFLLYNVSTIFEHIKLFDLHRVMFDTRESLVKLEEMLLLDKIADEAKDHLDLFYIGISYYQINRVKKANKYMEKGFSIYEKIEEVNIIISTFHKFLYYCRTQKNIDFTRKKDVWLTDIEKRLSKGYLSHKGNDKYFKKSHNLYEEIMT